MEEVYCEDCKHLICFPTQIRKVSLKDIDDYFFLCRAPENMRTKSNWLNKEIKTKYKQRPWELNKDNDCKYYKAKQK